MQSERPRGNAEALTATTAAPTAGPANNPQIFPAIASDASNNGPFGTIAMNPTLLQQAQLLLQQGQQLPLQSQALSTAIPDVVQGIALGMALMAGNGNIPQQVNTMAPQAHGIIATEEQCSACRKQCNDAVGHGKWDLFNVGNIHPSENEACKAVLNRLNGQVYGVHGSGYHIFQRTWSNHKANIGLWKCFKTKMTSMLSPRRGAAVKAWLLAMKIAVPNSNVPTKKNPDDTVSAQFEQVDNDLQPLITGYLRNDLHRVVESSNGIKEPIGNLAFFHATLAFLQSPDKGAKDLIQFVVDDSLDGAPMLKATKISDYAKQTVHSVSHLQLGSISQAIKSVLKNGYTAFRRPATKIGVSKVPEVATEAEKIWNELKVSIVFLYWMMALIRATGNIFLTLALFVNYQVCQQMTPNAVLRKNCRGEDVILVGQLEVTHISGYRTADWSGTA
jgi:hypothetical protein